MHSHFRTTHAQFTAPDATENARLAVEAIKNDFSGFTPSLIVYFAATNYDPDALAAAMHAAYPAIVTFGCTSAGEAIDARCLNASVVAMAFDDAAFDFCATAAVLGDGQEATGESVFSSVDAAATHLGCGLWQNLRDLDYREYVGFMLADSISFFSEAILDRLGELTDAFLVGGFSGDDYKFDGSQRVFYNGRAYRSAAGVALWKPRSGFSLLKTQAVDLTEHSLVITRADEYKRIIWEFNGEPAAPLYARLIGADPATMNVLDFDDHPLARVAEGEPFLQAVVQTVDGTGLRMFAAVKEGTRLMLTNAGDVEQTTARDLRKKIAEEGPFSAVLHVNCASRHTTMRKAGQCQAFARLFEGLPGIAFSSYGEIHVGLVALTSSMVLLK